MQELQSQGIAVDDDNEPAQENDAGLAQQAVSTIDWNDNGLCKRRMNAPGQQVTGNTKD
jgi:hypothetical protein